MIDDSALSEEAFQDLMNDPDLFKTPSLGDMMADIFKPLHVSAKTAESAIKMANTELHRQILEHKQGGSE